MPHRLEEWANRVNRKGLSLLLVSLLLAQVSFAATFPLNITPGRSWPLNLVVDSSRGVVYFDATSGEYPPTGFSFGIINATTHEVIKILPLDVYPGAMVLDEASGDVYVAGETSIAVFDEGNLSFGHELELGRPILSMALDSSVSPDLYVTSNDSILALSPRTGAVLGDVTLSNSVDGIQLDPSNGKLFVGAYAGKEITVLNASSLATMGTIELPGCCAFQFALDERTQSLYTATGISNYVYVVSAATDVFEKSVEVTQFGQNSTNLLAADETMGRIFVSSTNGESVAEIDGSNGHVSRLLNAPSVVAALAVDTKTQELYVANYHQVTVFDARGSGTVLLVAVVAVAVVAVGAVGVYLLIRRRDERERRVVERAASGPTM